MPLKLNVGLSRKVGEANYGSRGASVNLELELEAGLVSEPDRLQDRIRQLFRLAKQSVDEELNGSSQPQSDQTAQFGGRNDGTGQSGNGNGHQASQKQRNYLNQLAGQVTGLGTRRLESLSQKLTGKPLADLSSLDASSLIDTVKAIKDETLKLEDVLDGAAI